MARIREIVSQVKQLAREYRALTGRSLGITGEVAEYEAARVLGLHLLPAGTRGFDALRSDGRLLQIKGRCVPRHYKSSQRVGRIDVKQPFDAVLLVLMDER